MSRKRRTFDIDMPPVEDIPVGKVPDAILDGSRRGPMAAAIAENAGAMKNRADTAAAIRSENDRLAQEYAELQRDGLVVKRIGLQEIETDYLVRDRHPGPDPELGELIESIKDIGLSNPIRVHARADGRFELIQGMRRLTAFRALHRETGSETYATIPAVVGAAENIPVSYRQMVDENMVRKAVSFAEMALLAQAYAHAPANGCPDVSEAVSVVFKSASYTKRSYIRAFAELLDQIGADLRFASAVPRNLGVDLKRRIDDRPEMANEIRNALAAADAQDAETELEVLRQFLTGAGTLPVGKGANAKAGKSRSTFQIASRKGAVKCTASNGRLELRLDQDFSAISRQDLEDGIEALLSRLSLD